MSPLEWFIAGFVSAAALIIVVMVALDLLEGDW
jgi:hypothetical protein